MNDSKSLTALNKTIRMGRLYDFYGSLLTEKQKECLDMYYLEDLSLTEIAEQSGISRQAVHDILRRSEQLLEEYEQKLGIVAKQQTETRLLAEINNLINNLPAEINCLPEIRTIIGNLKKLEES